MPQEFHETIHPVPTLKELLIKSTLSPSVSIPEGIQKIDLGVLGEEAEGILDRSIRDPKGLERARCIYVTPEGGMLFQTKDDIGSKTEHGQKTESTISAKKAPGEMNLPRHLSQDRFYAGAIHSHGVLDVPPSPNDFAPLFRNVDSIGIAPMLFVITPEQKLVYFRSINTPQWDENDVNQKILHWTTLLKSNIQNKIRPGMPLPQQEGINAVVTHSFIRSIRDKYHLRLYSCPADKNIAVKEST